MGATSATGKGSGDSRKATTNALSIAALGPQIMITGFAESTESLITSPPTNMGTVVLPRPLPGSAEDYVVLLTTISGGSAYVIEFVESDLDEDGEDDHFVGFGFITEAECTVMYQVSSVGIKALTI